MPKEYKDLELARAKREPVAHLWKNKDWVAEEKEDGYRYLYHLGGSCSRPYVVSRRGEEVGRCTPQFAPQVNTGSLGYTVFDGEIVPPEGKEFYSLAGYTRVDPLVALTKRKLAGEIRYKVFDVLFINGTDVRSFKLQDRLSILDGALKQLYSDHPFVVPVNRELHDTYKFLMKLLAEGKEGVVLKNLKSTYGSGWIKAKRVSTFDAIITGFAPGYDLPCGAVFLSVCDGLDLREVGKCAISDTATRIAINKNPNAYIGQIIELKGLKIDPISGAIREPRFVRIRPDLKPTDCTWKKLLADSQIVELE